MPRVEEDSHHVLYIRKSTSNNLKTITPYYGFCMQNQLFMFLPKVSQY